MRSYKPGPRKPVTARWKADAIAALKAKDWSTARLGEELSKHGMVAGAGIVSRVLSKKDSPKKSRYVDAISAVLKISPPAAPMTTRN